MKQGNNDWILGKLMNILDSQYLPLHISFDLT